MRGIWALVPGVRDRGLPDKIGNRVHRIGALTQLCASFNGADLRICPTGGVRVPLHGIAYDVAVVSLKNTTLKPTNCNTTSPLLHSHGASSNSIKANIAHFLWFKTCSIERIGGYIQPGTKLRMETPPENR